MPTLAIDYTPAYEQGGGIGRYVRELVAALARQPSPNEIRLFIAGVRPQDRPPQAGPFAWRTTALTPLMLARIWHRARIPLPLEVFVGRVDLVHATDFVLPPTLPKTRTLLTVHDLSFVRVPEAASPRLRAYLNAVVPRSVARADHILADSAATRDDLIALYGTAVDKITVLLSGVEARFQPISDQALLRAAQSKYGIPARPYILAVGTVQPRKNYARLIAALAQVRKRGIEADLVVAGGRGWLEDPIYAAIDAHQLRDHVHFIGFADDADLPTLYSGASAVAVPSLYEGFGLPVLEAMACGVPVLTSNLSSLPEVAGDAALLVDPLDTEAIAAALMRLLSDSALRAELIARGLKRAAGFTWESAAAQLAQVYAQMLDT